MARVACESICPTGLVLVKVGKSAPHVTPTSRLSSVQTVKGIGYDRPEFGFDYKSCAVVSSIDEQSPDIAQGVDRSFDSEERSRTGSR
jgi:S-adenosylmethionine synthetase